ncbi:MAG TPA: DUF1552 domain-containing protein [Verrucomicrobiae bacterium]|nr:DUF1552 domain-containing protein [Verrucomicrobiae bacterium]
MNTHLASKRTLAAERHFSLSRRHFLRGLGACLALPAFESLGPAKLFASPVDRAADAAGAGTAAPNRLAIVYLPNGAIPSAWWPNGNGGENFQLSPTLKPLEKVRHQVQVISGLADLSADGGLDGTGDHPRAGGTFLTGVRIKKTAGADICAGVSIDQVVARRIGHLTRFPSLELTCDTVRKSGECDSGYSCAYVHNLAWYSATQPLTPEPNPRFVFERLFGTGSPRQRLEALRRRQEQQHSLLDFVLADAYALDRQLNGRDREKLDQYLTSVREVEQRIQKTEQRPISIPSADAPVGIPNDFKEHLALMFDMLLLAFQSDSTRVATLVLSVEENDRVFTELGQSEGHHKLTHHKNRPEMIEQVKQIDLWYVQQLARFLEKMEQTKDIDGRSLLHHSMIMYGSGHSDANQHSHFNLPIVLAGAGGGRLTPGRYLKPKPAPLTNLFLSLADRMGIEGLERHGDSTGRLQGIG